MVPTGITLSLGVFLDYMKFTAGFFTQLCNYTSSRSTPSHFGRESLGKDLAGWASPAGTTRGSRWSADEILGGSTHYIAVSIFKKAG